MSDEDLRERIAKLVDHEHMLRSQPSHTNEQRTELDGLEVALDQAWDLLRQRQALRDAGQDPAQAHTRPGSEVEGYLQ
jgi:hypothetical protein